MNMQMKASDEVRRLAFFGALACLPLVAPCGSLQVDFGKTVGPVKPVNGVGQGPLLGWDNTKMFSYLKDARIPYSRLHDVGGPFGKNLYVDIPNIFRDFDADETDPKNYDFAFTDNYIKALVENGVEPVYRLGVTIENRAPDVKPLRVLPPKDFAKWARICEHVVAHYTKGWANGFNYRIGMWEIWNEPDDQPEKKSYMWQGPWSEYVRLYVTVSKHLKSRFPDIKICGYGCCGFNCVNARTIWGEEVTPWFDRWNDCFTNFLAEVKSAGAPLDVFTFHSYADVGHYEGQIAYARKMLDKYGFNRTETALDEWLPSPRKEKSGTALQAAEVAAALCVFQNSPLDYAMIYDARCGLGEYTPFFDPVTQKPRKAYLSFRAFAELRQLKSAAAMTAELPVGVWATAATDGRACGAILLANATKAAANVRIGCGKWKFTRCRAIGPTLDFEPFPFDGVVPGETTLLIEAANEPEDGK